MSQVDDSQSPAMGRGLILSATVLWSLNGVFVPLLTSPTILGLHEPPVEGMHIAFYRAFFAGLVLTPTLRRREITLRPTMLLTALCFAAMNYLFVLAITSGGVASTLFLQYTAPAWVYLIGVGLLGEKRNPRGLRAALVALAGVVVIVAGGWQKDQVGPMFLGLGSGVTYALVLLGISRLRDVSSRWVTVMNLMTASLVLTYAVAQRPVPTWPQLLTLVIFGGVQLGLPYWLMARGLRSVSAGEAGTLTLVEPLLSAFWAYLVGGQIPSRWTLLGGVLILAALLYQYAPRRGQTTGGDVAGDAPPRYDMTSGESP